MITYTRGSVLAVCFGISALLGACGGDDYGNTPAPSSGSASVTLRQAAGGATYLADSEGRALYTFANDLRGDAQNAAESACAAGCLAKWPVFYMETIKTPDGLVASDFATITRDDGSKQSTYKGWPLYTYASDKIGDTLGDGVGNVWHLAAPDAD